MNEDAIFDIPSPSREAVQKCVDRWNSDEKYFGEERRLDELFTVKSPLNTDADEVFEKIRRLNAKYKTFYTTMENIRKVAERVASLGIDGGLSEGDLAIVDKIADTELGHQFSFASKYCAFHKPDVYPIYDRNVAAMLCFFNKCQGSLPTAEKINSYAATLKGGYKSYVETLDEFKGRYGLQEFPPRDFDHYLWFTGAKILGAIKARKKK